MARYLEPDINNPPDKSHCYFIDTKTGETFAVMTLSLYSLLRKAGYQVSGSSQHMVAVQPPKDEPKKE